MWTKEDAAALDRVTVEYKLSAYKSPARAGVSEEEWATQRARMKTKMDAMNEKLRTALDQPERWSRYLLWSGILAVALGAAIHYAARNK